ncbi:hypothetical protein TYRP_013059, partial [Tyrophagus putrescentiae]
EFGQNGEKQSSQLCNKILKYTFSCFCTNSLPLHQNANTVLQQLFQHTIPQVISCWVPNSSSSTELADEWPLAALTKVNGNGNV